jgi:hypothetical protein
MPTLQDLLRSREAAFGLQAGSRAGLGQLGGLFSNELAASGRYNLGQSQFFRQGLASLQDILSRQAESDAGAAAARGMSGGTFELAQLGQRNELLGRTTGELLSGAEQIQAARRQAALAGLLQVQGLRQGLAGDAASFNLSQEQLALGERLRKDQKRAERNRLLFSLLGQAIGFGASALTGGATAGAGGRV